MIDELINVIASHGDKGAVVPFNRAEDLINDFLELKKGDYHTSWLDRMVDWMEGGTDKLLPSDLGFEPRAIITIIMPSPKVMLMFNCNGKLVNAVVPPIYTNWDAKNEQAQQYLNDYLLPKGYSVAIAYKLPQKLLAVHCGLGLYGRNNVCYNNEYGSYMQIMTYITNMPCDTAPWLPIRRMEICEGCSACVASCPTGAIGSNRQLIDTDICLTNLNEPPGDFPGWVCKDAHNSIVGCVKCQDCCPGNAHNKDNIKEGVTFTEDETTELINHKDGAAYSDALASKLEATGISSDYIKVLPRNFSALI